MFSCRNKNNIYIDCVGTHHEYPYVICFRVEIRTIYIYIVFLFVCLFVFFCFFCFVFFFGLEQNIFPNVLNGIYSNFP